MPIGEKIFFFQNNYYICRENFYKKRKEQELTGFCNVYEKEKELTSDFCHVRKKEQELTSDTHPFGMRNAAGVACEHPNVIEVTWKMYVNKDIAKKLKFKDSAYGKLKKKELTLCR
ncbi:MAG: hypothetical protein LBV39_01700 [Bacteroidales bacterium]|nr:hypothetical protein [Bacteroidales bacterium]